MNNVRFISDYFSDKFVSLWEESNALDWRDDLLIEEIIILIGVWEKRAKFEKSKYKNTETIKKYNNILKLLKSSKKIALEYFNE